MPKVHENDPTGLLRLGRKISLVDPIGQRNCKQTSVTRMKSTPPRITSTKTTYNSIGKRFVEKIMMETFY